MTTRLATILRYALGVVAVLLTATTGRAATPSFDSFDTNDFRVVKTTAPWKILSNTANTTNNFTNVVVNYINSTIINTNVVVTNVNSTIVNTNTTIINQGDTIINTNTTIQITTNVYIVNITTNLEGLWVDTLGDYTPAQADQNTLHATNIYSMQTLHSSGALIFDAAATYNFLAPTNVCINPFNLGYLLIDGATTNAADTQIRLDPGNGSGAVLFIQNIDEGYGFHMLNGDTLCSDPLSHLYLKGGDWYSTHEGETIMLLGTPRGWAEIGRFGGPTNVVSGDTWQIVSGVLQPVDLTLQPMVTRWYVGTNSPSYFGATDMALNAVRLPDTGETQVTGMALYSVSTNGAGYFDVNMGTNVSFASMAWNVGTNAGRQATFRADSTEAKFLLDNLAGDEVWSVNDLGVMRWTPTNAMFLSGNDLVITNSAGSGSAGLEVATGDGIRGRFSAGGNLALVEGVLGVGLWDSLVSPRELRWAGNRFWPLQSGTDLGGDVNSATKTPFQSVSSITNSLWGYIGGNVTNWSRLMMTHTGTNGVGAGIVFESQANGLAGSPRPFVFTNAPVQLPWFTSLQKTNLAEVANGMLIYQTDNTPGIRAYVNGAWVILNTSADP